MNRTSRLLSSLLIFLAASLFSTAASAERSSVGVKAALALPAAFSGGGTSFRERLAAPAIAPGRVLAQTLPPENNLYLPLVSSALNYTATRVGPFIARVLGVGRDPYNPATLYAMTFGSGMYKSVDYGSSWSPASTGISYLTLQSMAVDPVSPNTLYAGTYGDNTVPYDGVFKSTNGGASWQPTGELANVWNGTRYNRPVVYALAVDPLNPSRVFAGTRMRYLPGGALGGGGVFRSDNGGATWTPVNSGLPNQDLYVYDLAIDPVHPGVVYAALHQHGLYRSDNYGQNWYALGGTPYSGRAVAVDPFISTTLYFGAVKKLGVYRSTDYGSSWAEIDGGGWDTMVGALSPDPFHAGLLFAGVLLDNENYYLMRSTDRGASWRAVAPLNTWGKIAFSKDGVVQAIGVDFDGLYRSFDSGQNWYRSNLGLGGYSVTGVAYSQSTGALYAALYGLGVYKSTDRGASWTAASAGLDSTGLLALTVDPSNPSTLYATTDQSAVYRSTDGGQSWGALSGGYPSTSVLLNEGAGTASGTPTPLNPAGAASGTLSPLNAAGQAGEEYDPYENRPLAERDDLKDNPDAPELFSPLAASGMAAGKAVAVSPFNSSAVLVGTAGRGIYRLNGSSWAATSLNTGTVNSLCFDRFTYGRALAAADAATGGVLVTTNSGQTWQASNQGLAGRAVNSLAQSPFNPQVFLAGTDSGVYLSIDGGSTWTLAGLSGQAVKAVSVLTRGFDLYFAATQSTVYYRDGGAASWLALDQLPANPVYQGVTLQPGAHSLYFYSRLGGVMRIDVQ